MNDLGLQSGLYGRIRAMAELVEDVLVRLRAGTSTPNDSSRQELASLLQALADNVTHDASVHLLRLLVRPVGVDWQKTGALLREEHPTAELCKPLEALAQRLDEERSEVQNRIRGWAP